ncbi:MAG: N-acetylmuramoyl-L-alanine amidase [Planctomycetes bacterium]|nr:N-acetylmuramoyl-L-alanine amidase [Planctomycetota bacterium]
MPSARSLVPLLLLPALAAQGTLFFRNGNLVQAQPIDFELGAALHRLGAGPTAGELAAGVTSHVPAGTRLLAIRGEGDERTLVFDAGLLRALRTGGLEHAIEQITKTALRTGNLRTAHIKIADSTGAERDLSELLPPPPALAPRISGAPAAFGPSVQGALTGRKIAISPGHGYYWHSSLGWTTQRGNIDGLIEDIHTAEICNHYLQPLLENLGATVVSCRERGAIDQELIRDNDGGAPNYTETGVWTTSGSSGYAGGGYRYASTGPTVTATANWHFAVPRDGLYPVYTWFRASSNRATDAQFSIQHSGGTTAVTIDQTTDNLSWVWLGEYWFTVAGGARVTLDNRSAIAGRVVIADAVRIGAGRGSIVRGSGTSNQLRWRESARYQAQFNGAPATVYDSIAGGEDNDDDVTTRPRFAEWRTADLFFSLHTNAGGGAGTDTFIYDGGATAGSATLQNLVQTQLITDIRAGYNAAWVDRGRPTANFGELRVLSSMPGVLTELAFHDTAGSVDHRALHDPAFRALAARAIARAILRYFAPAAPFPPEAPTALRVTQDGARGLRVAWDAVAGATRYTIEQSPDGKGFVEVGDVTTTSWSTGPLPHHAIASFRVRAWNGSGRSPTTEVLTAGTDHRTDAQVLLVQGFDRFDRSVKFPDNTRDYLRLLGDALRRDATFSLGFDAASNEAVSLGRVALSNYAAVAWSLGEESTQHETFSAPEQILVAAYLAGGGRLLVSGAELAWDLDAQGSAADRAFLRGQLGVSYTADDAGTYALQPGLAGTVSAGLAALTFDNGTNGTFDVDWPDVLAPADANSSVCLRYGNGQVAGIQRQAGNARVVAFGFPLATIVSATGRAQLVRQSLQFLLAPLPLQAPTTAPIGQRLHLQLTLPGEANFPYLLAISDAFTPGIALPGGGLLPLRDGFLVAASIDPFNPFFGNFLGTLSGSGTAAAWVDVPPLPFLAGQDFWFAGVTMAAGSPLLVRELTNWCRVRLQ